VRFVITVLDTAMMRTHL